MGKAKDIDSKGLEWRQPNYFGGGVCLDFFKKHYKNNST